MKVLALTHAQLKKGGLSSVSCERVDSITGTWAEKLNWDVDVIHTSGTKWAGIWPNGKGLKFNIIAPTAPDDILHNESVLFSEQARTLWAKKQIPAIFDLATRRATNRVRSILAKTGLMWPGELASAGKWGDYLSTLRDITTKKYDFIFVCVGYGDEYLLQTGLTLSQKLKLPMVVDFRDLWSDHHDPGRLTEKQKKQIRAYEQKLLANTVLISVPQKHMMALLKKWVKIPVYLLSHSAHVEAGWQDGQIVRNEFRLLYAGKLYASGPGLKMLLDLIKKLSTLQLSTPFKCYFFVDEPETLHKLAVSNGIAAFISVHGWVSPSDLWNDLRSAHLLVIPVADVAENYPLLPTKTFQYAYTGRQILCLSQFENAEMREFLHNFDAGFFTTNVDEAVKWVSHLSLEKTQYEALPPLRNVLLREQVAEDYGREIEKIIVSSR